MSRFCIFSIVILFFLVGCAQSCLELWNNQCDQDKDCCSQYCERGNPDWKTGVCKERQGGPGPGPGPSGGGDGGHPNSVTRDQFMDGVTRNGYSQPSEEQWNNFQRLVSNSPETISSKREAAMALAQLLHESGGLRYKREIRCEQNNCAGEYQEDNCGAPGKYYYGRGYIQLTWCSNYRSAGNDLGVGDSLVNNPDQVADNDDMAWATAFSYWKRIVHNYGGVQEGRFGSSTRAINGQSVECNGNNVKQSKNRFKIYENVFSAFQLPGSPDERGCYN